MSRKYDAIIIGAGCIGCSIAAHLAERGYSKVLVLEKEKIMGSGSTGKCAGGVRAQFSSEINIQMSQYGLQEFEKLDRDSGIQYQRCGYLFVLKSEEQKAQYLMNMELQHKNGVAVEFLEKEEVASRVSGLNLEEIVGGTFGERDGLIDPFMLTDAYYRVSRKGEITYQMQTPCTGLKTANNRITHVLTPNGEFECGFVINATGPHAKLIGDMLDLNIPIEPIRRMITTTGAWSMAKGMPMTVDVSTGLYMHQEGNGMLIGLANHDEKPGFDESIDNEFLETMLMTALDVMPALEDAEIKTQYPGTWAGLYETTPDHHAIIDFVNPFENFILAGGFSGHGLMHAPAAGKAVAELIIDGECKSFDLTPLRIGRFEQQNLLIEKNVI